MPCRFKQLLEKIALEKAPGPSPSFSVFHLLRAMELISEKTVGRAKLAEGLNVGEGAVRTILDRLKDAGFVVVSKDGCKLTSEGLRLWKEYKSVFKKKIEIGKNELTLATYNLAILINDRQHEVRSGVEQRDAAVMAGARGATTIMFKGGRLQIPSVSNNVAKDFPKAADQIVSLLKPEENDIVIIGSADTLGKAEYGALAAAWTLLNAHRGK
jgi:predicted transcriptional regulator